MATLTRRAFLVVAPLLATVVRHGAAAQQTPPASSAPTPLSVDEFLRLSQRLVGRTALDAEVAATYLGALLAVPANVPLLPQLSRRASGSGPTAEQLALERTIIEWWYTGTYALKGEPRLATHTGALMWTAMGMPAPGTCVNAFGAWSR
ncbi:MAG: sugar dehydrogenase complex small subunit, partial [Vicinamibacterales bacterium]